MIVGQGNDPPSKFAQMLAMQQAATPQSPYVSQATGVSGQGANNPIFQPPPQQPQQQQQQPPTGIYGPTSIIGQDYQQQSQPIDYSHPGFTPEGNPYEVWFNNQGSQGSQDGFYGPTSQMARDMQQRHPGIQIGSEPQQDYGSIPQQQTSQEEQQAQTIEYYRQALQNLLQQYQGVQ